jgi:hypothetical protein
LFFALKKETGYQCLLSKVSFPCFYSYKLVPWITEPLNFKNFCQHAAYAAAATLFNNMNEEGQDVLVIFLELPALFSREGAVGSLRIGQKYSSDTA